MVERLNLCLIDFRFLNSPEQRWHRPRCSSQASKSAASNSPSMPFPCGCISACLTGNVFGSRRCDCGDQLRLALALLEDLGGGIILYLAQEARRLGLANKMRTYQSQDDGLDTFDANTTLGFDDDERDYSIAACMLRMLYRTRIGAHERSGQAKRSHKGRIEIASRMPLKAPINADNRRYRSLDFRFEEFLRTRRAHVGLGDKGYPGIDIG
jgi:GTP cyclohydrolase II